jgi:chromosome transmission fidelity protein 18
MAKVLG